jgi:SAM-dependent methyltransferase
MSENDYDTTVMAAHWDQRYAERDQIWSGRPNLALIAEITGVAPGRVLDLGCGEGADAIWLGQQGWQVVGVDVSAVALKRAERHAVESGVADRVAFQKHDLALSLPAGPFDLVQAQFLHSTAWIPRDAIIRRAAALVVPGGLLLVVGHVGWPSFVTEEDRRHHHDMEFPTPDADVAALGLHDGWDVLVAEERPADIIAPDGTPAQRTDGVVLARRLD